MPWRFKSTRLLILFLGLLVLVVCLKKRPFASEGEGLQADAADLAKTTLSPHLAAPLRDGQNVLWCGTFQLAWNEICSLLGEDLRFAGPEPEAVAVLNQKSFTKSDIDTASYVAVADFVRNGVFATIDRQIKTRFRGKFVPQYLPPKSLTPRGQDIVAYACLFKDLEFETPFERLDEPLDFRGTPVPCFGIDEEFKSTQANILKQVRVFDYQTEDDFVIELLTESDEDRLILAKMRPQETLAATIEAVRQRVVASEPVQAGLGDVLKVPKCDFDLTRHFTELEGLNLAVRNPAAAPDLTILSALQNVRFEMNEKGVRLRSESHISIGCSSAPDPEPAHVMIFDQPFLVLLQRRDRDTPYFAMWVDNAELLVK